VDVAFHDLVPNSVFIAAPILLASALPLSHFLDSPKPPPAPKVEVAEVKEEKVAKTLCVGCTPKEQKAADFFFERGVDDRFALATVLGNIKQESMFVSNICEGGARIPYHQCHSGGYGLIQWTSSNRYYGLGQFARRIGKDPSAFDTQLGYLVTEPQWRKAEPVFKTDGLSVSRYMNAAYGWLGWGIHGNRTHYTMQYAQKLVIIEA